MTNIAFDHRQAAHCESGTISALLRHAGLDISEPMAFGLSGAMTFAYLPIIKIGGMPLISYRTPPGSIVRGLTRRLGVRMKYQRFRNQQAGMQALRSHLDDAQPVGLQTSVFWLPYFPDTMRFHFNAHNLLVYGRDGDDYLISDPVFEEPVRCDRKSLQKARFAKGALASKGMMYYPKKLPISYDLGSASRQAIKANRRVMTGAPLPVIGIRGIRYLGRNILKIGRNDEKKQHYLPHYLSHIVRMQEEIGTGGAGFRFIYASFLKETAQALNNELLSEAAELMTDAGDQWRMFALLSSKMCKGRQDMDPEKLNQALNLCADLETKTWALLNQYR